MAAVVVVPPLVFPRFSGEGDVIYRMDGILRRRGLVSRGVFDDVGPDGDIQVFLGKNRLQPCYVLRIGNVDGNIVGEGIHVLFVGDGHIHDLAPHEAGLGMLGPGKFIEGQIYVEAQVANLAGHGLMPQAEGVEGPRIEAGLAGRREGKGAVLELMMADIAVNVIQDSGIAVKVQNAFGIFVEQDQELFIAVQE